MTDESEVLKVAREPVETLQEWGGSEDLAAGPQNAMHLLHRD